MKTLSSLLGLTVLLNACIAMKTEAQPTNTALTADKFKWKAHNDGELQYLLYLPKDYSSTNGQRWPLMLFLHGSGERGTDIQRAAVHGPLKMVKLGQTFPFIIVAPQCAAGELWQNEPLLQLLAHIEKQFAVDTKRVYLTGISMGGYGAWQLGLQHPEKFAALVPICGGGNMIDVILGPGDKGEDLKGLPIWAFHGAKDPVVPLNESQRLVDRLKKMGVRDVKLTVYPEAQHDAWSETYKNPELYEWLLKQSR
jgi:predicted peptidase